VEAQKETDSSDNCYWDRSLCFVHDILFVIDAVLQNVLLLESIVVFAAVAVAAAQMPGKPRRNMSH